MNRTPQQWGDAVRQASPGFTGTRPRVQLWHGTNDTLVPYSLLQESIEQWTNVFGLSQTPTSTDTPQANWNRRRYADRGTQVEAYSIQGAGHSLPSSGMAAAAIAFFGSHHPADHPTHHPADHAAPTPPTTPPVSGTCRVSDTISAWNTGLTGRDHHHEHRFHRRERLVPGLHPARRPDHHLRVERHLLPRHRPGDRPQRQLQRRDRAHGSISVGFQATHTGNATAPTSFSLNGAPCAVS